MKEETHANLVREIAKYFDISDKDRDLLVKYTQIPDIEYKKKIFDFKRPDTDDPIEKIIHGLEWMGNAAYQGIEWKHKHGSGAIESFISHFQSAYEILIVKNVKRGKEYKDGTENLAYACHFIVDIGTPYHSKKLLDVLNINEISEKRRALTKEELNKYFGGKLFDLLFFVLNHFEFEDNMRDYWEDKKLRKELLKEIENAVKDAISPPEFSDISNASDWFKKYLSDLKENAINYIDILQYAYLEQYSKKKIEIDKINHEIFEYSKKCIYNITIVVALALSIFFPKKN